MKIELNIDQIIRYLSTGLIVVTLFYLSTKINIIKHLHINSSFLDMRV